MATPRKLRTATDYLIVGGGMAGMGALVEARRRGIATICLEARGKLGGRIRTVHNRRVRSRALAPHFVKSWHDDPWTRGGYSSLPVGTDHESVLRDLEAPEDNTHPQLFFAGDYVTRYPGSAHSAYQSGIAAVDRAALLRGSA